MEDMKLRSTADLEASTGIPQATWRFWRHCGEGPPSVRIGRRVFYKEDDVIDWINKHFEAEAEKRATV